MKEIRRVGLLRAMGWAMGRALPMTQALALAMTACGSGARTKPSQSIPPPAPILADEAGTPGTVEEECNQVVADLKRYGQCGLLDEDRKWWMGKWGEIVETDLALVKNPKLDAESKTQIAVSCRKAALVVGWAAAVCAEQAGQQPAQSQTLVKPSSP
jgi:hypothetical protein